MKMIPIDHEIIGVDQSPIDRCEPPHFDGCPAQQESSDEGVTSTVECTKLSYKPRNVDQRETRKKVKIKSLQEKVKERNTEIRKLENNYGKKKYQNMQITRKTSRCCF